MSIFFFTKNEEKIFVTISSQYESVTSISRRAKVSRTSTEKALKNLQKIGLVTGRKVREKNKHLYAKVDSVVINKSLETIRAKLLGNEIINKFGVTLSPKSSVYAYSGKSGIIECIEHALSIRTNERIYTLQGPHALSIWGSYLGEKKVIQIHEIIKKNELIICGVRSQSTKQEIFKGPKLKESFRNRLSQVHAVPDSFFEEKAFMYVFRNTVLFIELETETAVEISDQLIASSFLKIIRFLLSKTERDDLFPAGNSK